MRVVLMSSAGIGRRACEEVLLPSSNLTLAGILTTAPVLRMSYADAPVQLATHARFDDIAERAGCELGELRTPASADAYLSHLDAWRPDLLLALGWYHIVPRGVRTAAPRGCVGIHGSLLPRYRGGAPIVWAIINGERQTGATLFYFEDDVDAGDVIDQRAVAIGADDTCADVLEGITSVSMAMLGEMLPRIAAGTAPRRPQDHRLATVMPQRRPDDGQIDWSRPADRVHDFVRAQTRPYLGAFTYLDRRRLRLWSAAPGGTVAGTATGEIVSSDTGAFAVVCGDGRTLIVREASIDDGPAFTTWSAAERARVAAGARLGDGAWARST